MQLQTTINKDGKRGSPLLPPGIKNYLIDIDGTICEDIPNEEPERIPTAFEFPDGKEIINKWYDDGHIITFFTSRTEDARVATVAWLAEHGFKYHNIIFGKPRGGNYHWIDNAQVRATQYKGKFTEFKKATREIEIFEE